MFGGYLKGKRYPSDAWYATSTEKSSKAQTPSKKPLLLALPRTAAKADRPLSASKRGRGSSKSTGRGSKKAAAIRPVAADEPAE